jgi:hypothetical protein
LSEDALRAGHRAERARLRRCWIGAAEDVDRADPEVIHAAGERDRAGEVLI